VIDAAKRGEKTMSLDDGTIITAAARDRAQQIGIRFEQKRSEEIIPPFVSAVKKSGATEIIAIGSDHGGFQLKEILKPYLDVLGYKVMDLGTHSEEACDYPDYAYAVAKMVAAGDASRGIMIDSVGIASVMVANKVNGIRAACCFDEYSARSSREHNNANVLTLGGKTLGAELAKSIMKTWLETSFGGGRHQRRLDKITAIEKRLSK
jgi:ribose 5-phosphate isomerase B